MRWEEDPSIQLAGRVIASEDPEIDKEMKFLPGWEAKFEDNDTLWITAPNPKNPSWMVQYRVIWQGDEPVISEMRWIPDEKVGWTFLRSQDYKVPIDWARRLASRIWYGTGRGRW